MGQAENKNCACAQVRLRQLAKVQSGREYLATYCATMESIRLG